MQQNWLPGSTPGVGGLIRLSPLLNDNDNNEYAAVAAAAVVGSTQVIQMVILWKISLICQGLIPVH